LANTVFEISDWLDDVLKGVDLPEEEAKALRSTLERAEVRKEIGNSVLRQSDYSRQLDALKTDQDAAAEARAEGDAFLARNKDRDHNNSEIHKTLADQLDEANRRLSEGLGDPVTPTSSTSPTQQDDSNFITLEQLDEINREREQNAIAYSNKINQLSNKHHKNFDEYLDFDALVEHATKNSMNLDDAYHDMHKTEYDELNEKVITDRIDVAVKEALVDARSNKDIPGVDVGPKRVSGLDIPDEDRLKTEDSRVAAALGGLAGVRSGDKSTADWI
jgi:hypothetical protein